MNLAPFLGVMIALAFLFILPRAIVVDFSRKPVDLVRAMHPTPQPGALREDSVEVSVTRDGNVFCNGHQVQLAELPGSIQSAMLLSTERKIYLKADARAKYGDVKAVVEEIRQSGITQICFLAEKGEPSRYH